MSVYPAVNTAPPAPGALLKTIESVTATLTCLNDLLIQEGQLLKQREDRALAALVEKKNELTTCLMTDERALTDLIAKIARMSQKTQGPLSYLLTLGKDSAFNSYSKQQKQPLEIAWKHMTQAVREGKRLSAINEQVIRHRKKNAEILLSLLLGQDPDDAAGEMIYRANGEKKQATARHSLGQA